MADTCQVSSPPRTSEQQHFSLTNVGSLQDGQLRLFYGAGATKVDFALQSGILKNDKGEICYLSDSSQLQCNRVPQTRNFALFSIRDKFLAFGTVL